MNYRVTVFFSGPRSAWGGKLHESEIIHRQQAPWLWMARLFARGQVGNAGRCAYVIHRGEDLIEQVDPQTQYVPPA